MLFGVISPFTIIPCLFLERPSSFLQFGQVENIRGHLFGKIFLICFTPLSLHAESKEDDEYFANHLQMYVSRTFTIAKKSVICAEYPISSKFHLCKWKTYFSQFIDKFLKIEENVISLILCKFPLFSQTFWMLVLGCTLFPPIYTDWKLGFWMLL